MCYLPKKFIEKMVQWEEITLAKNKLVSFDGVAAMRTVKVDLSHNSLNVFPEISSMSNLVLLSYLNTISIFTHVVLQKILQLQFNKIKELPDNIRGRFPQLEKLDISFNELENLPPDLVVMDIKEIIAVGNPLGGILPAYRNDNSKVLASFIIFHGKRYVNFNYNGRYCYILS